MAKRPVPPVKEALIEAQPEPRGQPPGSQAVGAGAPGRPAVAKTSYSHCQPGGHGATACGPARVADAGKKAFLTLGGLAAREIMPIFANGAKREDEDITRIPASVCAGILSFYDSFPHGSAPGKTMINA